MSTPTPERGNADQREGAAAPKPDNWQPTGEPVTPNSPVRTTNWQPTGEPTPDNWQPTSEPVRPTNWQPTSEPVKKPQGNWQPTDEPNTSA